MRVAAEPERRWLLVDIDRGRVLIDQAEPPDAQGRAAAQPVRIKLSDEILASMDDRPLRLAAIAERVGRGPKDGSVRNALAALVEDGKLSRQGHDYVKVQAVQTDRCTLASRMRRRCTVQAPLWARRLCTDRRPRTPN